MTSEMKHKLLEDITQLFIQNDGNRITPILTQGFLIAIKQILESMTEEGKSENN